MKLTVLLPDLPEEVGSLSDLVVTLDCFDISDECDVVVGWPACWQYCCLWTCLKVKVLLPDLTDKSWSWQYCCLTCLIKLTCYMTLPDEGGSNVAWPAWWRWRDCCPWRERPQCLPWSLSWKASQLPAQLVEKDIEIWEKILLIAISSSQWWQMYIHHAPSPSKPLNLPREVKLLYLPMFFFRWFLIGFKME